MKFNQFFTCSNILVCTLSFMSCSSQEYTTAKLAIQQSDFAKASEWLPKAMAVEPDNPEIPMVMAIEIHAKNENWEDMINLFNKAMDINPEKEVEIRGAFISVKEAVSNYVDFYWAKEFNAGVAQFQKMQDDPQNKKEYLGLAIKYFSNAVLINPLDANSHSTLAKCYLDKGDNESAIKSALVGVEKNPDSFDANFGVAQIMSRIGSSSKDILPYYEKATIIQPSNSRVLRELAGAYYDLGQKEKSIQVFENAISNEENDTTKADLYFNLGVIHNQMNNFEAAELAFDEAFFLNEEDFEAALGMARSYEGLGDNYLNGTDSFEKDLNEASRWYRKAEKKIKSVMVIDIDNKSTYQKNLELVRYKRDVAEGN
ncbi:MAG: tetratricopeptide repeat protein [Candidatus Neomarinimicrobiota bacterium]